MPPIPCSGEQRCRNRSCDKSTSCLNNEVVANAAAANRQQHNNKITSQSAPKVDFAEETFTIVKYVIYFILQTDDSIDSCPSAEAKRFRELVQEILNKHDVYNSLCGNLHVTPANVRQIYYGIVETMFEDNVINWGRLVALLGFSVKLAEHLRQYGDHDDAVVELAADVLVRVMGKWIVEKGGWSNVLTHFATTKDETTPSLRNDSWVKGILVTATLGLGAILAVTCK